MVRFGVLGDFGRINYDIVSAGKWSLNYNVTDPWLESVKPDDSVDDIVSQVLTLLEQDTVENRTDRWMYAKKHFTPAAMKSRWIEKLFYAFSN